MDSGLVALASLANRKEHVNEICDMDFQIYWSLIKMSEISLTQRFDDSMSSCSSDENKRVKILQLNIYRERR